MFNNMELITLTTKCTFKTNPVEAKNWFSQLESKTHHFVFCLFSFSNHAISVCSLLFSFFFFLLNIYISWHGIVILTQQISQYNKI